MIKIENTEVTGFEAALRGARNPKNSWHLSDSGLCYVRSGDSLGDYEERAVNCENCALRNTAGASKGHCLYVYGPKDLKLLSTLANAGDDHGKFLRMINVTCDITAPVYWAAEHDTYKVGTTRDSCSFMHKGVSKEFDKSDFSTCIEETALSDEKKNQVWDWWFSTIELLNQLRDIYIGGNEAAGLGDSKLFEVIRQILPSGYNTRYTWQANYQVLRHIYHSRKNHRLPEWHDFCKWIEELPYAKELIIGNVGEEK